MIKYGRKYEDTYTDKGRRKQLIELLKTKGITDTAVLDAMNTIPRHYFLDAGFETQAYEDRAFDILANQTISQPYTVAYQTQLLEIKKGDKVLEIGTGSVYQTTVLAEMGARVFTIERQKQLFEAQKDYYFKSKYLNIKFFYGDGFEGLKTYAPFDKIIITAAAPFIPPKLVEQLKPYGFMIIPVDEGEKQRMMKVIKQPDGSYTQEFYDVFSFVPMLTGKNQ